MKLDEIVISKAIIETFSKELVGSLDVEVAIAGAGPAGLTAGFYLAQGGVKTSIFETNLRVGGGMPGGGIMFNKIVVQEPAREILEEMKIRYQEYQKGYYTASSLEAVSALTYRTIRAGAKIFNLIGVEDVMVQEGRVNGFVLNWGAVKLAGLHVDPIGMRFKMGIDATGHQCEVIRK
ncbi:thiazole biosynthesis protein, partial [Candidatus Aerophobetes bacterium]